MTCPVDGQLKITDAIDATIWNPADTSIGGGTVTFEAHPDSAASSNQVMVLNAPAITSGTRDESRKRYRLRRATFGDQTVGTPTYEDNFSELRGYHKLAIKTPTANPPADGAIQAFFAGDNTASAVFNFGFRRNGSSSNYRVTTFIAAGSVSTTATGSNISLDEEFELRWHFKASTGSNGILRVDIKRQSDEDWVTVINITNHAEASDIVFVEMRCRADTVFSNGTYDFGIAHVEMGLNTDADWASIENGYEDFKACWVEAAKTDRASFKIAGISPDRYRSGTHFRINYGTTESLGTATARTALKAWNPAGGDYMAQAVEVTALTAGTRYYWRVEIGTDSATTLTSDIFTFKTSAASGSSLTAHFASCSENDGKMHPLRGYKLLADNIDLTDLDFSVHAGDWFYEASQADDPDRFAPETEAEYRAFMQEAFEDRYRPAYMHSTVVYIHPGDHAVYNNAQGVAEKDDNVSLIKNHPDVGSNYNPSSSSTYKDVWDAALGVWDAWVGLPVYNAGTGYTGYIDHGSVRIIALDNLLTGDFDNTIFFGTAQIDWLKARCAEVPANTTIIVAADTAWGPVNEQNESVNDVAPLETQGFNEWAETPGNVADGVKIIIMEGDTHRGWWVGKAFYDTDGNLMTDTNVLAFNSLFAPIGQTGTLPGPPRVTTDETEISAFDMDWFTVGEISVTSGGVLNLSQNSARLRAWGDDAQELDTSISIRATTGGGLLRRNHYFIGQGMGLGI